MLKRFVGVLGLMVAVLAGPSVAQEAPPAIPVEPVDAQPLAPPSAREFDGSAVVFTSITLEVAGETLVLFGLQAFGNDWRAEAAARAALDQLTRGIDIRCIESGRDRHRRLLAICTAAEIDIAEAMLGAGMALVDRTQTRRVGGDMALADRYDAAERAARDGAAGLWITVPGYQPVEPPPPPPGLWDRIERFQAGIAVLIGLLAVAIAIVVTGRRRGGTSA
jgi:hypothetical protein